MSAFNTNLCLPDTGYSNLSGRLDTSEDVTSSDALLHEKQKASEDKISDKSSYLILSIEPNTTEDSERRDSPKNEEKTAKKSVSDQKDLSQDSVIAEKHTTDSGEENEKSISEDSKREENAKTAAKKISSDDEKSKTLLSSRQSEVRETASSSKDKIAGLTGEEEGETKQVSVKTVAKGSSESTKDTESKEDEDLNKHDEKSTGVSSTESMLNVEKTLSPVRTPRDKKSENVKESDDRERPEIEASKSNI